MGSNPEHLVTQHTGMEPGHSPPWESSQDRLIDDSALLLQPEPWGSFFLLFVGDGVHISDRGTVGGGKKALPGPILLCSGETGPTGGHLRYSR